MDLLVITHSLNGLLMVGMPVGLGIYLSYRFKLGWRLWWIGALTFVLSQVGHIPFNSGLTTLFQAHILPNPPASWKIPFNAVVLGLSAGLFEECFRAAAYRWAAKDARSWHKGIMLGAGHGGMEAILLGGLVLLSLVNMLAARNMDLSKSVPAGQLAAAQQAVTVYWTAPWLMTLLGAVERLFTIPVQITLSVLVLQAFTRRQPAWIVLAILYHAFLDASTLYLTGIWSAQAWSVYAVEGWIGLFALVSLAILFGLRQPEPPSPPDEPDTTVPPHDFQPVEMKLTQETLEKSKYQ